MEQREHLVRIINLVVVSMRHVSVACDGFMKILIVELALLYVFNTFRFIKNETNVEFTIRNM